MGTALPRASLVFLLLIGFVRCGKQPTTSLPPPPPPSPPARTCDSVIASFDTSVAGLEVSCDDAASTFTLRATGVPAYDSNQSTPNEIRDQMWTVTFPMKPFLASTKRDVIASRGPIGFMINGIPFYGPQNAQGRDAIIAESATFDDCTGHADPSCRYHYHNEPVCIAAAREPDDHPGLIGYALDGFALYARGAPGSELDLDECNGHEDAVRGYHYHATPDFPYLMACFAGAPSGTINSVPPCRRGP